MARTKRGPGRPSLGNGARTNVVAVKFSEREIAALEAAATEADVGVSSWIRERALESLDVANAIRIEVERDESDWHWVAYDREGRPLSACGVDDGPRLESRVRKAAIELGVRGAEDAEIVIATD